MKWTKYDPLWDALDVAIINNTIHAIQLIMHKIIMKFILIQRWSPCGSLRLELVYALVTWRYFKFSSGICCKSFSVIWKSKKSLQNLGQIKEHFFKSAERQRIIYYATFFKTILPLKVLSATTLILFFQNININLKSYTNARRIWWEISSLKRVHQKYTDCCDNLFIA